MPKNHAEEYANDFAKVAGKQKLNRFFNVIVNSAAFFNCGYDGCEVVVGKGHVGGAFRNVGAGNAHSATDIGGFKRRSVVNAVARHCNNIAVLLPSLNYTDFIFRRHTSVYRIAFYIFVKLVVGHLTELVAGNNAGSFFFYNTELFADCGGGSGVVARNHDGTNTGVFTFCDRFNGLGTRRVNHA